MCGMSADLELFDARETFRGALDDARARGQKVALVPTMGALHHGHLALAEEARRRVSNGAHRGLVAMSIFVNPTQFGPKEDFGRYPRDLEGDLAKARSAGVDVVFAPTVEQMYPPGDQTRVRVGSIAEPLCGAHRPGHFEGVATVVAKLFALAGPCVAVFGKKDYQQLQVIRRMATDLGFPVDVVGMPTVREPDGLAMSSRNAYLSADGRQRALAIPRALAAAARAFAAGERRAGEIERVARASVEKVATSVDYVSVADPDSLVVASGDAAIGDRALVAIAIRIDATRLIDNMVLGEDEPPRVA
jgi:pantoate--beta-alanine ligase